MKRYLYLALGLLLSTSGFSQDLSLLHKVQFDFLVNQLGEVGSSDCWGWEASDGTEYAIIGNYNNVAFVRASDGLICDSIPAPALNDGYYHRDMVTYGNYAYCVAEMNGVNEGLMIFDLTPLPDSVRFVKAWTDSSRFARSHNIDIDAATGFLYIESDGTQGIDIVDVNNPENPVTAGFIPAVGIHDMHARNDTVWTAQGNQKSYRMLDVSDKGNPVILGEVNDPNFGYCHNIWPSDDGRYFVTTEETSQKTVKIWDAQDPTNIQLVGQYLGNNGLAHNVHVMGDYIFISHYTTGVTVVDFSDPANPFEVAAFDTYPTNELSDFYGCWGTFPYTSSGKVYASNFEGLLYILQWDPTAVNIDEPNLLSLGQPFPSYFSDVVNVPIITTSNVQVEVTVRNLQGNLIDVPFSRFLAPGNYTLPWHPAPDLESGLYLLEVKQGTHQRVHRIIRQ